ncbi:MAG: hypothetical protein ACC628_02645 [Pirellulaceae bacterium]
MAITRFFALPFSCWLLVVVGLSVQAQDRGGSKVVNPFETGNQDSVGGGGRYTARISDEEKSAFHLSSFPSLPKPSLPKIPLVSDWKHTPRTGPARPSTWDKIRGGAKSVFGKTKRILMPWAGDAEQPAHRPSRSRFSGRSTNAGKPRPGTKTLFSSWFKPKEKEIRTVNEWLSLPRVPLD